MGTTIERAREAYETQLRADGRSEHTIGQARRHVALLGRWMEREGLADDLDALTHEHVAAFLGSAMARTRPDGAIKRATSVNALRSSVRSFFGYCHAAGFVERDPARLVRRARCGAPPPRALSDVERRRLLDALGQADGPVERRDRALFELMLASGLRLGAALGLHVDDVDLDDGELHVRRDKGDRPSVVPIPDAVRARLAAHVEAIGEGPLFVGRDGNALGARQARARFTMWCRRAGIRRAASPHALRHTFATKLYEQSRDLLLVRDALGHRSIASTMVYATRR